MLTLNRCFALLLGIEDFQSVILLDEVHVLLIRDLEVVVGVEVVHLCLQLAVHFWIVIFYSDS